MWIQVIVMGMGISGQIQDILKVAPTVPTDEWHIVYEGNKSQELQNL